jgi:hypothetical protein
MPGSVSSLDSDVSSSRGSFDDEYDSDEEYILAQQEWEESIEQLQQLVSIVVLPFVGRYFGRKLSYWGMTGCDAYVTSLSDFHCQAFARYIRLGLGKSFFFGARAWSA